MTHHHRKGGPKGAAGPPSVHLPGDVYHQFDLPQVVFWKNRSQSKNYTQPLRGLGSFMQARFTPPDQLIEPRSLHNQQEPEARLIKRAWELREVRKLRRQADYALKVQQRLMVWDPYDDNPNKTKNAFFTLFVGRLSSSTTEEELRTFMETTGGEVVSVRIVRDIKLPSRVFAFVEFAEERSLQKAYRAADGVLLGGRHIVVDVERGRTVRAWTPRRLGGGLGGPARLKGYTLRRGRGMPEPPRIPSRKRRPPPMFNDRQTNSRYGS